VAKAEREAVIKSAKAAIRRAWKIYAEKVQSLKDSFHGGSMNPDEASDLKVQTQLLHVQFKETVAAIQKQARRKQKNFVKVLKIAQNEVKVQE